MRIYILSRTTTKKDEVLLRDAALSRGHESEIISYKDSSLIIDKGRDDLLLRAGLTGECDAVIPRFMGNNIGLGVAILRQYELGGVYSLTSSVAISRVQNQIRTLQILSSKGIPVPKTLVTSVDRVDQDTIDRFSLPVVVYQVYGSTSQAVLIETEKTLRSVLNVLKNSSDPIIIQEHQILAEGGRFRVLVSGSSVIASLKVMKKANGASYKPAPLKPELRKIIGKVSKATGLQVFEAEIIETEQGPNIIGVSAVPDITLFQQETGRDVATKIIEYVERNAKSKPKKDKVGA